MININLRSRIDEIIIELHDLAREYKSPDLRKVADDLSQIKSDMINKSVADRRKRHETY